MSKEVNRRESALSDAELESVSGASQEDDCRTELRATMICNMCSRSHCGGTPILSLGAYLKEHGKDSVRGHHYCPYYKP